MTSVSPVSHQEKRAVEIEAAQPINAASILNHMKTLVFLLFLVSGMVSSAIAAGGIAAKEAVRNVGRERGASWVDRIIQITGDRGMDQPTAWHIVAAGPRGALREFFVGANGILSDGPVPAAAAAALAAPQISQAKLVFDSTHAFTRAETAARKARIGFDTATYRLRCMEQTTNPGWYLELNNAVGQKVGDVIVSATSGKVLRFIAYNPPPVPPPAAVPPGRQALENARKAVNRSAQGVGTGLRRTGEWISRKFAPRQPEYYVPQPAPPR